MAGSSRSSSAFQLVACRADPSVPVSRLPPASPSSSSSGGRSLFPFLFPSSLHPRVPSSRKCTAQGRPPRAGAARRAPSPPGYCSGPAGTRLPIPYMDKCVQAKSGIQAPDVSLQRSGHRTGDRGEGGGEEGGGEHQPAAAPGLPKFHFLSVGSLPGPAPSFPGISSISGGKEPAAAR